MIEREGRWAIDTDEDCRFVEPPTVILTDRDLEDLEKLIKARASDSRRERMTPGEPAGGVTWWSC